MPFMGEDAEAEITGDEELPQGPLGSISFANLDETDFEEFCYDLLFQLGFVNIDWRKGTPKKASPSDRGRDIVAQLEHVDVDGHRYFETWFIEVASGPWCKRATGVGSLEPAKARRRTYARGTTSIAHRARPCRDRRAVRVRPASCRGLGGR